MVSRVAVGVTGVAEGGVPLDRDLHPTAPLLWWHDERASAEAAWLADRVGRASLFAATGVDVAAKTPLANWLWLRRHEPATLIRMRAWVGIPDLVATALCGTPLSHRTFAGRSGAFDQLRRPLRRRTPCPGGDPYHQLAMRTSAAGDHRTTASGHPGGRRRA